MSSGGIRRGAIVLAFLLAVLALAGGVWRYGYQQALDQLNRQAASELALASDRLKGQLQRYRELSVLTADHPLVSAVLAGAPAALADDLFQQIADKTAALDLLLVDAAGHPVASARGTQVLESVFEPARIRAMNGALGWGHGLVGEGSRRAFYYAAPVFGPDTLVRGALIVVVDLGTIEWDWVGSNPAVFFTDAAGQVFVTNRSEIVFWNRPPGEPGLKPASGVAPPFASSRVGGHEIWKLGWGPYLPAQALHITRDLPVIGMAGEALVDVAPARRLALLLAMAVAGLFLAFGALLFLATERRRTLALVNVQLEARVAERTRALSDANAALRGEMAEREVAQRALARAQADLVEAGKLSALGQMSAGLSHELNQPLMAIRSFAENAVQFLDRGRTDRVSENLDRISDLARRMGRIIRNLRAFARQESEPAVRTDLVAVLRNVLELTEARCRQEDIALHLDIPEGPVWVRGGEVRLGQVFGNLVTNAVDAMVGQPRRELRLSLGQSPDGVTVELADTGPGIDVPEKVFEPFYSTKDVGAAEGMGLGLSISYGIVQSFGGAIRGQNGPDGAVFAVTLQRWDDSRAEAAA